MSKICALYLKKKIDFFFRFYLSFYNAGLSLSESVLCLQIIKNLQLRLQVEIFALRIEVKKLTGDLHRHFMINVNE